MTHHLYVHAPTVVFQAQVNQASFTYPIAEVAFDGVAVGAFTAATVERLVVFGTTQGGDDLGRQRVRKAATSSILYFGRSSRGIHDGEVDLTDDCWLTVYDIRLPFARIPFIDTDGTIYKDHDLAWSGQTGDDKPPKARAGADTAGTIDSGTSKLRVQLPGTTNTSYATATGATISSYAWSLPTGVTLVSGYALTDAVIQVDCDPGFYQVKLEVTDSNTNTHAVWVKIYARDPDSDDSIQNFQIERHPTRKDGQELALRILDDIPAGTYIDGTVVMLWEGEPASVTDRTHMRFTGWHHTDPAQIQAGRTGILRDTTFECLDIAGKLRTLPGFPIQVERKATPASWLEMSDTNMDLYLDYILRWHSNAFELCDFLPSGTGSDYPFVVLGSDGQTLWDQAARRAAALVPDYHLVCNPRGQLSMRPDPMIQSTGDRTSTIQATITEADWTRLSWSHQRAPRYHWLREEAILAHTTNIAAVFAIAPGGTPGQGAVEQPHGEQLAKSHADLLASCGNRYGRINAPEGYFSITLAEGDTMDIEPSLLEWVRLTMSADTAAQRGLAFTNARGLVHEVNVNYRHERTGTVKEVTLLWEKETSGNPAEVWTPPDDPGPDDWEPDPDGGFEPDEPPGTGDGLGTLYVATAAKLGRTRAFSASSPAYADITPAGVTTIYDFILDPWAPATTAYLQSEDGLHKSTDMDQASPTWNNVLTVAEMNTGTGGTFLEGGRIMGSINVQDYIVVFIQNTGGGADTTRRLWCARSTDGGSNWNFADVFGFNHFFWAGGADIVPRLIGGNIVLYTAVRSSSSVSPLYKSTDGGANWSVAVANLKSGDTADFCTTVHCPYNDNPNGDIVYVVFRKDGAGAQSNIYRVNGAAVTNIRNGARLWVKRMGVETYTQDRQQVYYWYNGDANTDGVIRLFISSDGGDSFTEITPSGLTGITKATGGFPFSQSRYYAATQTGSGYGSGGIFISSDGGQSFVNKTGDFVSAVGALNFNHSVGTNSRLYGTIVPLWTEEA